MLQVSYYNLFIWMASIDSLSLVEGASGCSSEDFMHILLHGRSPFAFPELRNQGLSSGFLDDFCVCQRRYVVLPSIKGICGVTYPTTLSMESYAQDIRIVSVAPCTPTGTGDAVRHLA